jgi:hypothetical protein
MSNLWTFGDSFTEGFNEKYPWADEYIKWKGYTPTEIMLNRNSLLYVNEVNNWIELLNRTFKCNKIIHWSPLMEGVDGMYLHLLNRIKTETNEEVNDGHYGEKGHIELSNIFFEKIKSNKNKLI